jgi:HEAT repeat protein
LAHDFVTLAREQMGLLGQGNAEVLTTLLTLLWDQNENEEVRQCTAIALGQIGQGNAEVLTKLLTVINDEPNLRESALDALWEVVEGNEE